MKKKIYQSPQIKVVELEVEQHLLTASTEGFTVGNSYDDDDFDN